MIIAGDDGGRLHFLCWKNEGGNGECVVRAAQRMIRPDLPVRGWNHRRSQARFSFLIRVMVRKLRSISGLGVARRAPPSRQR
jgi:hypothetical protein